MRNFLFFMILFFASALYAENMKIAQDLLSEALSLLPPITHEKIKNNVTFEFKDLGPFPENLGCIDFNSSQKYISGYSINYLNKKMVLLNSQILNIKNICKFGNKHKYLLSVLIHELSHIIDKYGWAKLENCASAQYENGLCPSGTTDKISGSFRFKQFTPSLDSVLMRSPDPYEKSHPREYYAVNFEYFILDPNFKCNRPFLFQFFSEKFSFDPYPEKQCNTKLRGYFFKTGEAFDLKIKNIRRVSYLLAGSGPDLDSNWGHSMLEILTCSTTENTEDCEKNNSNYLIVSFRALVPAAQMGTWEGFIGKYKSAVFFYKFSEIKKEYDEQELRDLERYPLKLNIKEQQGLIFRVFEKYWGEFENYFILTNNCASETLKVIQSSLSEAHSLQGEPVLTPKQLASALKRASLISADAGAVIQLSTAANKLRAAELKISQYINSSMTYEKFRQLTDVQRKNILIKADLPEKERKSLAGLLYILEWRLFYQRSALILSEAQAHLVNSPEWKEILDEKIKTIQNPLGVWNLADKIPSYGIPDIDSLSNLNDYLSKPIEERQRQAIVLYAKMTLTYPPITKKLDSMRRNLEFFKKSAL